MRVFVSYTTKDPAVTQEALERVAERITPFANVFIDILHNKKGKQCRVNYELYRTDIVLLIDSPGYQSKWVQKELFYAREQGKPVVKAGIKELITMDDDAFYHLLHDVDKKERSVQTILIFLLFICVGVVMLDVLFRFLK